MLVTSIFHNVFYHITDRNQRFTRLKFSSANVFNLDQYKILSFGKELNKRPNAIFQAFLQTTWLWTTSTYTGTSHQPKHCMRWTRPVRWSLNPRSRMWPTFWLLDPIFTLYQVLEVFFPLPRVTVWTLFHTFVAGLSSTLLNISQTTNFRCFQTEIVCRRQFQIWWKWQKFSKLVENTVGKGEIVCYEKFLIFPQCFQKTCTADTQKPGLVWERVNTKWLL